MIFLILIIFILILQHYLMHCFSYLKSVNNLKILIPSSNNLSSLFLTFSLDNILNFLSFLMKMYSSGFSKNSYFSLKVAKSTYNSPNILFISSSKIFNFLSVSFFISFISCSLNSSTFFCLSQYIF